MEGDRLTCPLVEDVVALIVNHVDILAGEFHGGVADEVLLAVHQKDVSIRQGSPSFLLHQVHRKGSEVVADGVATLFDFLRDLVVDCKSVVIKAEDGDVVGVVGCCELYGNDLVVEFCLRDAESKLDYIVCLTSQTVEGNLGLTVGDGAGGAFEENDGCIICLGGIGPDHVGIFADKLGGEFDGGGCRFCADHCGLCARDFRSRLVRTACSQDCKRTQASNKCFERLCHKV